MARGFKIGLRKLRDCNIYVAKTKALISCAVTAQRICFFVFAYAKSRFSHNEAHMTFSQFINVMHGVYFLQGIGIPQGVE